MKIGWEQFRFPFDDERWINKLLVGGLLALGGMIFFPISWFVGGYYARIMHNAIDGNEAALPEWEDWGDLFRTGAKLWAVGIVYAIPVMIPLLCLGVLAISWVPALPLAETDPDSFFRVTGTTFFITLSCSMMWSLVSLPISLAVNYFSMVAQAHVVAEGPLDAGFRLSRVGRAGIDGFKYYGIVLLLSIGIGMALGVVIQILVATLVLIILLPFMLAFTSIYLSVVTGNLVGVAYRLTIGKSEGAAL